MSNTVHFKDFQAGKYQKVDSYQAFIPSMINHEWAWTSPELNLRLEEASIAIGKLNAMSRQAPNVDLFIHLLVQKEAVVSSRIEGTRTRMDEALLAASEIDPERRDDWQEVQNYTEAMNESLRRLDDFPLSSRMLREAHHILLSGVRGEHKNPGEFRRSQNWIGGRNLSNAKFIPPVHSHVPDLMTDLERFIHNDEIFTPNLVRAAILHYQFETIHPFLDGNGRIGRLLITLYLIHAGVLKQPLLYLSAFFERDKMLYYDNLTRVRRNDELLEWVVYFLIGVKETANEAAMTLTQMMNLKLDVEIEIKAKWGARASNGLNVLEFLFKHPVVQGRDIENVTGLTAASANQLLNKFIELKVLEQVGNRKRNRLFMFKPLVEIFAEE